jgi:two-component sensor histidine kinase
LFLIEIADFRPKLAEVTGWKMGLNLQVGPSSAEVFITEELLTRQDCEPDYLREKLAIQDLAEHMTDRPSEILSRLVKLAMDICDAESSGISVLEGDHFRWFGLCGVLSAFEGATTPRNFSPCGVTLDQNVPTLMERPERVYDWIREVNVVIPEVLLVPLVVKHGEPIGTLWVVSSKTKHFTGGHARVVSELAAFAGAALRMVQSEEKLTAALQQQETLAREMSHRVKNLFAIIGAMIRLTGRTSVTKEEMMDRLGGRVEALASANALVRRAFGDEDNSGVSLSEIIERILRPYNHTLAQVEGAHVSLGERTTNDVALIFHELATNAAKYGALSQDGAVAVKWTADDANLIVDWVETGGPATTPPMRNGFGTLLVSSTIANHGGQLTYDWRPEGLAVKVRLPLGSLGR